ncbi:hypothetical protein BEWA_049360 [Theileria equi strain WA]|uniref:Signal peptide-containing protein n=1 Tax=Theileria equi strain WA TaxID=1537102 RepID=L1LB22_THEEQ|nr:hypothetical protein BEWA_049360 [Theileria equi strain WA]EKX72469.1 hypothetical protein BEWA_049360 [Theileria equi strain WA]|eukprot:XP_004831921.1 hypothetical protein BEWA_049360 [Theileria equi strain WA]
MVVIQLLLFLFTCILVRSENVPKGTINGVVLDVDSINSVNVTVEEGTLYGVAFKSFFLRGDQFFTSVVEGGATLWKAGAEGKCTAVNVFKREGHSPLLTLYNKGLGLSCFEKEAGEWKAIGAEEFDLKHAGMRAGSRALPKSPVLDLGHVDDKIASNYENLLGGALQKSILPIESFFSKVTEYGATIWDGSGDKECSMAFYRYRNGAAILTLQVVGKGSKAEFIYFKNVGSGWVSVSEEEFKTVDGRILGTTKYTKKDACTLDLSSVDTQTVYVDIETENGLSEVMYIPKHEKVITAIVDRSELLWVAKEGEVCSLVFFSQKDSIALLDLHIKNIENEYESRHFERVGAAWTPISVNEYDTRLDELKESGGTSVVTLDISEPSSSSIEVDESTEFGVSHTAFLPADGHFIKSVMDGSETIWVSGGDEVCLIARTSSKNGYPSLLILFNKTEYRSNFLCFVQDGSSWKQITKGEYNEMMKDMDNLPKAAQKLLLDALVDDNTKVTLDLVNPNKEKITVVEYELDEAIQKRYTPNAGFFIASVVESETSIWDAVDPEECVAVGSYSKNDIFLIVVQIKKSDGYDFKYFEKVEGKWEELDEVRLSDRLEILNFYIQKDSFSTIPVAFDIYKSDDRVTLRDSYHSGVHHKQFSIKRGFHICHVSEGENRVWSSTEGEKCTSVNLYNTDELSFITLWLKTGKTVSIKRFEQIGGNWEEITMDTFSRKLQEAKMFRKYEPEEPADSSAISLDISVPDRINLAVHEEIHFKVLEREYSPKKDVNITSVVDSGKELWKVSGDEKCIFVNQFSLDSSTIIYLRVKNGEVFVPKCFEKTGDTWKEITEDDFFNTLDVMMGKYNKESSGPSDGFTLDIANPSKENVISTSFNLNGANQSTFRPKNRVNTTSVVNGENTIWEAKNGEKCTIVSVYTREDDAVVCINTEKDGKERRVRLEKIDNDWVKITKSAFFDRIKAMSQKKQVKKTTAKLDIVKLDVSTFGSPEYLDEDGVKHTEYTPREGSRIVSVVDGSKNLWVAQDGEDCFFASFSYSEGVTTVYLDIIKDGEFEPVSLKKQNGEWSKVTDGQLNKEIEDLLVKRIVEVPQDVDTPAVPSSVLDLAAPNEAGIDISTKVVNEIVYKKYSPKKGSRIDIVMDSGMAVWSIGSYEECKFVKSYTDGENTLLTVCFYAGDDYSFKYFTKNDTWVPLSKDSFAVNLEIMLNHNNHDHASKELAETGSFGPLYNGFKLDLENPDLSKLNFRNEDSKGVNYKGYDPKDALFISSIVEGDVPVWRSKYDDKCIAATVASKGDSKLLSVFTICGYSFETLYFEKNGNEWTIISGNEFKAKMGDLSNFILDISNLNETKISTYGYEKGNVSHKGYIPKGEFITRVVDGEADIWTASRDENCKFVSSYTLDNFVILYISVETNKTEFKYFGKGESGWTPISSDVYYDLLWKFTHFGNEDTSLKANTTLNIEYPDPSTINAFIKDYRENDYTCGNYTPKEGVLVNSVIDSDGEIWTATGDERCTFVAVYYSHGTTILLANVKRGDETEFHCFERTDIKWIRITESQFFDTMKMILKAGRFTLDIADPDKKKVEVYDREIQGVKHRTFFPNRALELTKVTEAGVDIWTGADGDKCTAATLSTKDTRAVMLLHVKNGDSFEFKYFGKNDGKWSEVDRDTFYDTLRDMMENSGKLPTSHTALDLAKPNENKFVLESKGKSGISYVSVKPKKGVTVTSVSDSKIMLWKGRSGEKCKKIELYNHSNHTVLYMRVKRSGSKKSLRFVKTSGKWKKIGKKEFFMLLRDMMEHSRQEMVELARESPADYSFDISSPDDSKVDLYEETEFGVSFKGYTPKPGVLITSVFDEDFDLWIGKDGEKCVLLGRHINGDSEIISLYIQKGQTYQSKYFVRGVEWLEITKRAFFYKLNTMKEVTCTIDISNPDDNVKMFDDVLNGVNYRWYYPKNDIPVTSVVDSGFTFWKSNSKAKCPVVNVYTKGDITLLLLYVVNSEKSRFKYFEKIDGEWIGITEAEFDERLNGAKTGEIPSTSTGDLLSAKKSLPVKEVSESTDFVLDISNPDVSKVFTIHSTYNDLDNFKFAAYSELSIAKVVDGKVTFWEAGSGKKGTLVDLLYKAKEYKLFAVIPDQDDYTTASFFERVDDEWTSVDFEYYQIKLNDYYQWVPSDDYNKRVLDNYQEWVLAEGDYTEKFEFYN